MGWQIVFMSCFKSGWLRLWTQFLALKHSKMILPDRILKKLQNSKSFHKNFLQEFSSSSNLINASTKPAKNSFSLLSHMTINLSFNLDTVNFGPLMEKTFLLITEDSVNKRVIY